MIKQKYFHWQGGSQKLRKGLWSTALTFAFFLFYSYLAVRNVLPQITVDSYLWRDLRRTEELLRGNTVLVGPDLFQGSFTTGPFFYLLNAPLVWFHGPDFFLAAAQIVLSVLGALAGLALWQAPRVGVAAWVIFLFMANSFFIFINFAWPTNASLLPVLAIAAGWLLYRATEVKASSPLYFLAFCGLFAAGIQVHLSLLNLIIFFWGSQAYRRPGWRRILAENLILFSVTALGSMPLTLAWANQFFHWFDGPHFNPFYQSIPEHFQRYRKITLNAWVYSTSDRTLDKIEILIAALYTLLRGGFVLLQPRSARRPVDIYALCVFAAFLATAHDLLFTVSIRYGLVWFPSCLALVVFDGAHLLRSLRFTQRQKFFAEVAVSLGAVFWGSSIYFFGEPGFRTISVGPSLADARAVCDFFNHREISFEQFKRSTIETVETGSDNSFGLVGFCFKKKMGGAESHTQYYLVAKRYTAQPDDVIANSPAGDFFVNGKFSPGLRRELETTEYVLYSQNLSDPLFPQGNLTNIYYLDLGLPLKKQLLEEINSFSSSAPWGPVTLSRAPLCSESPFCDLYALTKNTGDEVIIRFISRPLQTVWEMLPLAQRLHNVAMRYECDHKIKTLSVASWVGAVDYTKRNASRFTPFDVRLKDRCLEVRPLDWSAEEEENHLRYQSTVRRQVFYHFLSSPL